MTRPADPRGASRRKPSTFGAETGYDNAAPTKPRTPYQPHRPAPQDHGCHGYDRGGVMFTRCADHQPAGSRDCGPVRGACPECARGA